METGSPVEWNETLLKMARPDIYRVNAFRVLGLPVTASPKELSSHIRRLELTEKYGSREQIDDSFLTLNIAHDRDARREAQQRLLDPELRFIDEFFWFWPLSLNSTEENDDTLAAIKQNDIARALTIWGHHEAEGSEANISLHNIAVFHHAMALDFEHMETQTKEVSKQQIEEKRSHWQQAFSRWKRLLNEEGFWQRVRERIREFDDPRLTIDTACRIREGLPKALLSINAMLAVEASGMNDPTDMDFHLAIIRQSGFDDAIAEEAKHRAIVPIRDRIKAICLHSAEEIVNAPERGNKVASSLITGTAQLFKTLDSLLAEGNSTRESVHDEVALQIRSCLIAFGNETEDWRAVLGVAEKSLNIAESPFLRQKIRDDLEAIRLNAEYMTCWFCGGACAESDSSATVMMHGNVEHVLTQVRWQYLPVKVPRCARCKSAHKQTKAWRIGGIIAAFSLAIFIGIASSSFWVFLVVLGGTIAAAHGLAAATFPKGTKPESYKNEFRTVKEMLSRGWKMGGRPSGV